MRNSISKKVLPYLFIAPCFILLFIFNYYAMFLAFKNSFENFTMGYQAEWVGFTNYIHIVHDKIFLASMVNQMVMTIVRVILQTFLPLLAAELLFFVRHKRMMSAIRTAFIVPMMVPGIVIILIWRYFYNPSFGLNSFLQLIGLQRWAQDWLNNSHTALWSVLFVGLPFVSGLYFLIYHAGLNGIGTDVHEAAIIDGAGSADIVFRIHLACIRPYINVIFTLALIGSLSDFGLIAATTNGGPGYSSMIPAMYMYQIAFGDGNMGYASTIGVVMFLIIMVLTILTQYVFKARKKGKEGI